MDDEPIAPHSRLAARRARVAAAWAGSGHLVLIGAGEPIPIPGGADQTYPFIAHAEYYYLADRETPGAVLAFDPKLGWTDFVPVVSEAERVWEGKTPVDGTPLGELAGWLAQRRGRPVVNLGAPIPGVRTEHSAARELRDLLTHARRAKDPDEIACMRRAAAATAAAYDAARESIRPGVTERALQIRLETAMFEHGAQRTAYASIVGTGPNAAVLHFMPTQRALGSGEVVLIDAAAEVDRYAVDVTRTYIAGDWTGIGKALYETVVRAEERAMARCTKGIEWHDVHLGSCRDLVDGLIDAGILLGKTESLVERGTHALFYPHGIGHMVGLGVRDASGTLPGRAPRSVPGLKALRIDFPLEPGYAVTVEPGIYFIRALLEDPVRRREHADAVNWACVDEMLDFGGIRIEDNVLVTDGAPEILTAAIPK